MSCKEKIEQTSEIGRLEMQWLRGKLGELFPWVRERHESWVKDPGSIPDQRFKIRIHTHVCTGDIRAVPSSGDLFTLIHDVSLDNIRNWYIASVSETGEVEGYFCMHATPRLIGMVRNQGCRLLKKLHEEIYYDYYFLGHLPEGKTKDQVVEGWLEELKMLGLSTRTVSMGNYTFNGERFIKKI